VEILLVRHGQPGWADGGTPQMDPALTDIGKQQADLVGKRIAERGADEIISSPAKRALATAAPLAALLEKKVTVVDDLLELRLPDWSHLSLLEVAQAFRSAREREPEAWWQGMPGGENFRSFIERVQGAMRGLLAERGVHWAPAGEAPIFKHERDIGRIVIFGHGGTNSVATTVLLGLPSVPWEWERFTLCHAGVIRLKATPLGGGFIFSMRSFNDCEHLPKPLRTI
jgi:2,3-bisphosphoglycerate-dependent phosphoglycerate mutase